MHVLCTSSRWRGPSAPHIPCHIQKGCSIYLRTCGPIHPSLFSAAVHSFFVCFVVMLNLPTRLLILPGMLCMKGMVVATPTGFSRCPPFAVEGSVDVPFAAALVSKRPVEVFGFHRRGVQDHRLSWLVGLVRKEPCGFFYDACSYRSVCVSIFCKPISQSFIRLFLHQHIEIWCELFSSVSIVNLMFGWMLLRCSQFILATESDHECVINIPIPVGRFL